MTANDFFYLHVDVYRWIFFIISLHTAIDVSASLFPHSFASIVCLNGVIYNLKGQTQVHTCSSWYKYLEIYTFIQLFMRKRRKEKRERKTGKSELKECACASKNPKITKCCSAVINVLVYEEKFTSAWD